MIKSNIIDLKMMDKNEFYKISYSFDIFTEIYHLHVFRTTCSVYALSSVGFICNPKDVCDFCVMSVFINLIHRK